MAALSPSVTATGPMIQRDDDPYAPKKQLPWDVKPEEKPADRPQDPGRLPPDWAGTATPYDPSKPPPKPGDDPNAAADKDTLNKASAGLGKAVLKIPQVKAIIDRVLKQAGSDLQKAGAVSEVLTGETLASVVAAMVAGNAELPVQIPEIPLELTIKPEPSSGIEPGLRRGGIRIADQGDDHAEIRGEAGRLGPGPARQGPLPQGDRSDRRGPGEVPPRDAHPGAAGRGG